MTIPTTAAAITTTIATTIPIIASSYNPFLFLFLEFRSSSLVFVDEIAEVGFDDVPETLTFTKE